ncbi:LacI family DNA-binding transcriptional regulator [Sphingobacterium hotanense]|uniref:LacI family DNA-binding transcriptional regulator n=1 Tax=Sphingobacterium hotanense TaxID=649196 RepID=UPI0021A75FB6|nr:LacI family DNA-binding transcriptional regulator [Sphingobacterium hotanense]MCT1524960.1 LacI family transcriptional regulator [Sphingobacterium hotanense]
MRITLKDIAKALNLSASTVSKALSDSYEISAETKKTVKEYAAKHNFRPNKVAQNLKTGKTNTVGVILCNISNNFVAQLLDGIQTASEAANYDIIIMQSRNQEMLEKQAIEVLRMRGIDGLLLTPMASDSSERELRELQDEGIPVVLVDRTFHSLETHKVGANNFDGAYQATMHLADRGKKRIMHITGRGLGVSKERFKGFLAGLEDSKLKFIPELNLEIDYAGQPIEELIKENLVPILKSEERPDAIFCATDEITSRTLGVLADLEIAVPKDIAVIGFSNTPNANALNPALSAVVQPARKMGELGFQKLTEMINSKNKEVIFETIALDTELVIRKSSL